jgi:hypothetical protein
MLSSSDAARFVDRETNPIDRDKGLIRRFSADFAISTRVQIQMNIHLCRKVGRSVGISSDLIEAFITRYREMASQPANAPYAQSWHTLLDPLRKEINRWRTYRAMHKWPTDLTGAQLWLDYFELLTKTRDRLYQMGLGATGLSLQEAYDVFERDGRACSLTHWSGWVPDDVRAKFVQRFDEYFKSGAESVRFRRTVDSLGRTRTFQGVPPITPFTDSTTRRRRMQRWDALGEAIKHAGQGIKARLLTTDALVDPELTAALEQQLRLLVQVRARFKVAQDEAAAVYRSVAASRQRGGKQIMPEPPSSYWSFLTQDERDQLQATTKIAGLIKDQAARGQHALGAAGVTDDTHSQDSIGEE